MCRHAGERRCGARQAGRWGRRHGGAHPDVPSAVRAMVHVERVVTPDAAAHAQYAPYFEAYKALYGMHARFYHVVPFYVEAYGAVRYARTLRRTVSYPFTSAQCHARAACALLS